MKMTLKVEEDHYPVEDYSLYIQGIEVRRRLNLQNRIEREHGFLGNRNSWQRHGFSFPNMRYYGITPPKWYGPSLLSFALWLAGRPKFSGPKNS